MQLLDLPNETLLDITARVPYSTDGKSIINLRLVNRQLRDLLTNETNLIRLRHEIARIQYPVAHCFRVTSGNHTWNSLQDLDFDDKLVLRMMNHISRSQDTLRSSDDNIFKHCMGTNYQKKLGIVSKEIETDLLTLGLHLFAAADRAALMISSEFAVAVFIKALGFELIVIMRLVADKIAAAILTQIPIPPPEFGTWFLKAQSIASSTGCPAIENLLFIQSLVVLEGNLALGSRTGWSNEMEEFFLSAWRELDKAEYIDVIPVPFPADIGFGGNHQTYIDDTTKIAVNYDHTNFDGRKKSYWGIVADDIIAASCWRRNKSVRSRDTSGLFNMMHMLGYLSADYDDIGEESMSDSDADEEVARDTEQQDIDWHKFAEDNTHEFGLLAGQMLRERGMETSAARFEVALSTQRTELRELTAAFSWLSVHYPFMYVDQNLPEDVSRDDLDKFFAKVS